MSHWTHQTKHKATDLMQVQIKRGQFVEEQLKEEIRMLRANLHTIQEITTTALEKSNSMLETLNVNIERGKIGLKVGTNDDIFQSHNKNKKHYCPKKKYT